MSVVQLNAQRVYMQQNAVCQQDQDCYVPYHCHLHYYISCTSIYNIIHLAYD